MDFPNIAARNINVKKYCVIKFRCLGCGATHSNWAEGKNYSGIDFEITRTVGEFCTEYLSPNTEHITVEYVANSGCKGNGSILIKPKTSVDVADIVTLPGHITKPYITCYSGPNLTQEEAADLEIHKFVNKARRREIRRRYQK